jgi:succinate dehydrogenase/fumarate reductase flavoprotein subunit
MNKDIHTEIAVVGAGPSGMAAAFAATRAGADVLVVERAGNVGGNAVFSTGWVALVGTAAQREGGVDDSVERFLDDAAAELERERVNFPIYYDEALTRRYAEESPRAYEFLLELGMKFARLVPRPKQHSVDRLHAIDTAAALETRLAKVPCQVKLKTGAERLLVVDGRIAGVRVVDETTWETTDVLADRGVILAAGGFQANPALRQRAQPGELHRAPYMGLNTCQGDGHLMGDAVGGDLVNMTVVPLVVRAQSGLIEDCIAVNRAGVRFSDEAGPYAERLAVLQEQEGGIGYYVTDDLTYRRRADIIELMPVEPVRAATLGKLAEQIGCPADALVASVERWNDFLASDADPDPDFGRVVLPEGRRPISEPPFLALQMVPGILFPGGGFRTTLDMQVVNCFDEPIPGLYAVGDCAGGVKYRQYGGYPPRRWVHVRPRRG